MIGSVAGVVAFVELEQPWFLFAGTILGFVFGGVIGSAWEASGSDNFPNVPPRRAGEEAGAELVFESAELTTAL